MLPIVREIVKLIMFTIIWLIPVFLARWNSNNYYLWLFVVSALVTAGVFDHFEIIVYYESGNTDEDNGSDE